MFSSLFMSTLLSFLGGIQKKEIDVNVNCLDNEEIAVWVHECLQQNNFPSLAESSVIFKDYYSNY
jgi:hypothetical protein